MVRRAILLFALAALALFFMMLSSCERSAAEEPLRFRVLAENVGYGGDFSPYDGPDSLLVVVDSVEGSKQTEKLLDEYILPKLQRVPYAVEFVLLMLRGDVGTRGRARIMRIEREGSTVSVYVFFEDLVPGNPAGIIGSPYQLAAVERPEDLAGNVTFKLYAKTLGTHPDTGEALFLTDYEQVATQKHHLGGQQR